MITIKVPSLRSRIILQFVVILIPLVLVLIYQTFTYAQQLDRLRASLDTTVQTAHARDNYKVFVDGVIAAVDTGRISERAHDSLLATHDGLLRLKNQPLGTDLQPTLDAVKTLLDSLRLNASFDAMLPLRITVNKVDQALLDALDRSRAAEQTVVADVAYAAKWQVHVLLVAAIVSLFSAAFFVVVMIRGLTQPLGRAVALASSFARGDFLESQDIELSSDIGGLLHSLDAMRKSLSRAFQDLKRGEARIAHAQRIAQIGDWELDTRKWTLVWSDEAARIFGRSLDAMPGPELFLRDIVHPEDRLLVERCLRATTEDQQTLNIDFGIVVPDGGTRTINCQAVTVRDAAGNTTHIAGTVQHVTVRKAADDRIRHLATHDSLTGLPNRQLFDEQVARSIAIAKRNRTLLATMFVDLDRFKLVNDTLGHGAGDILLKEAAERMKGCLPDSDANSGAREFDQHLVARQGGDEFAIMLTNLTHRDQVMRVANRLLVEIARPFIINELEINISASIGISLYPEDGLNPETLLKHADSAMYHAKDQGKNNYQYFLPSMNAEVSSRLEMESALRRALAEEQFVLHYQPLMDLATGRVSGCEALIRWNHPDRGLVAPNEFIPIAEECGLIVPIGEWALRTACVQGRQWQLDGHDKLTVAVNWASQNFSKRNGIEVIRQTLASTRFDPSCLELEMTERSVMQNTDSAVEMLQQLKALGIRLSIDDFGTGFSSLAYLKRFPIDTLKVDRSFVKEIPNRPEDNAIVTAILSLAQALNLDVVAEGVETAEQAEFLRSTGCPRAQGFLYSRAVPESALTTMLVQQRDRPLSRAPLFTGTAAPGRESGPSGGGWRLAVGGH